MLLDLLPMISVMAVRRSNGWKEEPSLFYTRMSNRHRFPLPARSSGVMSRPRRIACSTSTRVASPGLPDEPLRWRLEDVEGSSGLGFRLSLLSTHVRYCLAFRGGRRLLKDQLDGYIATGGIGVGTDRVGNRDQFFAYGSLHSRQLDVQLDL